LYASYLCPPLLVIWHPLKILEQLGILNHNHALSQGKAIPLLLLDKRPLDIESSKWVVLGVQCVGWG